MHDFRRGPLEPADRAMLTFASKLTQTPGEMTKQDLDPLRVHGFSDAHIHHIVQITALFNYYNRLADGLGIDSEPEHRPPDLS